MPLQAVKVGFVGSAEAVAAVASFVSDYPELPVITYMPDLSWWDEQQIDNYLDALRELLLPQTAVLVGHNTTLRHWLLPDTASRRHTDATDLARAAAELGVSYVLVTGLVKPGERIGSVLVSPQAELCVQEFERIEADFLGAGDTLSAALTGLLAMGSDLTEATVEALQYLDQAWTTAFAPAWAGRCPTGCSGPRPKTPATGTAPDAPTPDDLTQVLHDTKH
jgi:hydroxymethylpyrimidine/phosphomethylpyrimidine kinase